jgi:hypothetical protein
MTIELKETSRGFLRGEFTDRYGEPCSIQESSIAGEFCIWLGCEHETKAKDGEPVGARMHLTQVLAAELLPLLERFIETGELAELPSEVLIRKERDEWES